MKKTIFSFFISYLLLFCQIPAEIIETNHFSILREHMGRNTLVLIDIDNTLIRPAQFLGSDMWFRHRLGIHKKNGSNSQVALDKSLAEWTAVQNVTNVQLVEEACQSITKELQNQGHTVICLTTRGLGLATRTIYQLHTVGIDMTPSSPTDKEIFFDNEGGVLFRRGILFTAGSHKGKALQKLLEKTGYTPSSVVFINDKLSHIKPIEETCREMGIPFTGIRYGACDAWMESFDPAIASVQFLHLGEILSDQTAAKKLRTLQEVVN